MTSTPSSEGRAEATPARPEKEPEKESEKKPETKSVPLGARPQEGVSTTFEPEEDPS